MTEYLLDTAFTAAFLVAIAIILDVAIRPVLTWCAGLLPDEFCGPDGWLNDTKRQSGVFDRKR